MTTDPYDLRALRALHDAVEQNTCRQRCTHSYAHCPQCGDGRGPRKCGRLVSGAAHHDAEERLRARLAADWAELKPPDLQPPSRPMLRRHTAGSVRFDWADPSRWSGQVLRRAAERARDLEETSHADVSSGDQLGVVLPDALAPSRDARTRPGLGRGVLPEVPARRPALVTFRDAPEWSQRLVVAVILAGVAWVVATAVVERLR